LTQFLQSIENFILGLFSGNAFWAVFFIAMLPLFELRGSIIFGKSLILKSYGINNFGIFLASYFGAMIVIPIISLFYIPLINLFKRVKFFSKPIEKIESKFKKKGEKINSGKNDIFKMIGIALLVAVPLPGTGGWTAAAIAVFIGLGFLKSLISIAIGNLICGGIMMLVADVMSDYLEIFMLVFFIFIFILLLYFIYEIFIKKDASVKVITNRDSNIKL